MKKIKLKIKTQDTVKIIAGNNKNKIGKVLSVNKISNRAVVSNVNTIKKHVKPSNKNPKGGIVIKEASIHISNLALVDPSTNKITKIGRKMNEKNKLQRYSKSSGKFIK